MGILKDKENDISMYIVYAKYYIDTDLLKRDLLRDTRNKITTDWFDVWYLHKIDLNILLLVTYILQGITQSEELKKEIVKRSLLYKERHFQGYRPKADSELIIKVLLNYMKLKD